MAMESTWESLSGSRQTAVGLPLLNNSSIGSSVGFLETPRRMGRGRGRGRGLPDSPMSILKSPPQEPFPPRSPCSDTPHNPLLSMTTVVSIPDPEHEEPPTRREKMREFLKTIPFQVALAFLIIADLTMLAVSYWAESTDDHDHLVKTLHVVTLIDALLFFTEVMLRAWSTGWGGFFKGRHRIVNTAEFCIITACVVVEGLALLDDFGVGMRSVAPFLLGVFRVLWFCRFARLCAACVGVVSGSKSAARSSVSGSRRRHISMKYDLDLAYVTPRIIAMSWPGSGIEQFYRNSIHTVAAFLDEHHADHYKVYNLCKERGYNAKPFHGAVERVMIDDHNAADLEVLHAFCRSVEKHHAQDTSNVIAVHCKAGKGRTGTCICCYLMYSGVAATPDEAMSLFAEARASGGFAGVESPSQARYVRYFHRYLSMGKTVPSVRLRLKAITVTPLPGYTAAAPSQLWMVGLQGSSGRVLYHSCSSRGFEDALPPSPSSKKLQLPAEDNRYSVTCSYKDGGVGAYLPKEHFMKHEIDEKAPDHEVTVQYDTREADVLCGDVRFHWFFGDRATPVKVGSANWWIWFNTGLVDASKPLEFTREEIDGPHKNKAIKKYPENFAVKFYFTEA